MKSRKLTVDMLKKAGAMAETSDAFYAVFGETVDVTVAIAGHYARKINWGGIAHRLLSPAGLRDLTRIRDAEWAIAKGKPADSPEWLAYLQATARAFAAIFVQEVPAFSFADHLRF